MKKLTKLLFCIAFIIGIGLTAFSLSRPSLIRGITHKIAKQDAEFKRRVLQKFPAGTSHEEITKELGKQGFEIRETNNNKALSSYQTSTILCSTQWYIVWDFSNKQNIVITTAQNSVTCL